MRLVDTYSSHQEFSVFAPAVVFLSPPVSPLTFSLLLLSLLAYHIVSDLIRRVGSSMIHQAFPELSVELDIPVIPFLKSL